jgi:TatD DNase family protein
VIFDTHAHYDDEAFDEDREELLSSLAEQGIRHVIDIGSTAESLARVRSLADRYPFMYGALGLHPDEVGDLTPEVIETIKGGLTDPKIVAVGEIGLDYYWNVETKDTQIACFKKQIEIALHYKMPIIVHSRSAAADTMEVVAEYYGKGGSAAGLDRKGIIHCYSYSPEQAKIYTEMGFFLGIGGVITFKNAKKLKQVVSETPIEKLVLETDSPYLAPEPYRGKRNSSAYLPYVVKAIADLKGMTEEDVERVTYTNAMALFDMTD